MKKLLVLTLFLAVLTAGAYKLTTFSYSFCDKPIHFRVDSVDPKFNLSKDQFLADINESANIWSKVWGKDLFVYDPKGSLSVNLIYDERQSLTTQINQLENKVQSDKQIIKPEISEYNKLSTDFKQKVDDLNKKIAYWNNHGGAPEDEYKKISDEQKSLQTEADHLNALAKSLNTTTQNINSQIGNLNQNISEFNSTLEFKPEEGVYKVAENRIEIYFNISQKELIHTLAHELGHALGIKHIDNKNSIMYFKTTQNVTASQDDIDALEKVCKRYNLIQLFLRKTQMGVSLLQISS